MTFPHLTNVAISLYNFFMKFVCNGADLSDAASKVFRAVSPKGLSPILEGIKVVAKNGFIELVATDNELTIQKKLLANTLIDGQVVVPGKLFCEFVKRLDFSDIEISVDSNLRMHIKYGDNKSEILCMSAEEYPTIHKLNNAQQVIMIKSELRSMINSVEFCCCLDDSRPILKGVSLEVEDHSIIAVALDGFRLAKSQKPIESTTAKMSAVVPRRSLLEVVKIVEDNTEPVSLQFQKNYIMIDLEHTQIISRLYDGDFVNYRQIIPGATTTQAIVSREQLASTLERASLVAGKERTNLVKYDIVDNVLDIASNSQAGAVSEKLVVTLEGPPIKIAFNATYFMQLLRVITSQNIELNFTNPTSPAVIKPSGGVDDTLFLVLPVRLA